MEQFCSSSRVLFILFLMTCQASIVITVSAIVCVFVCLFLFDWASSVFAAISWCGSAILSQRAAKTPRTSCPTAQNQVSNQLLLCSPIKGFPFQMKQKANCLLQANTVWVHSTHFSAKGANFTVRLYRRLSSSRATKIAGCQLKRKTLQSQTISGKVQGLFTYVTFIIPHFLITWLLMNSRRLFKADVSHDRPL